jgi:hypothetical protein
MTPYDYPEAVKGFLSSEGFASVQDEEKPIYLEAFRDNFIKSNEISDKDDISFVNRNSSEIFTRYRNDRNIPRFTPTPEQALDLYGPININPKDDTEKRIAAIEQWRDQAKTRASEKSPSTAEDFEYHVEDLANNYIKNELAKDSYKPGGAPDWLMDASKRFTENAIRGVGLDLLGEYKDTQRWFAKNLVENPEFDQDYSSQVAGGLGNMLGQLALSAGLTAAGAPELAVPAMLTMSVSRHMTEAYQRELQRTGNELMAQDAATLAIPAGAIDAVGESMLGGFFGKAKGFKEAFSAATTTEAKRLAIKEAIPGVLATAAKGGAGEGFFGGVLTTYTGNMGDFIATGDKKYYEAATNIGELAKSFAVEGTVGAIAGGMIAGITKSGNQEATAKVMAELSKKQDVEKKVLAALKENNFDSAIRIVTEASAAPATPAPTPTTTPVKDAAEATLKDRLGEDIVQQNKFKAENSPYVKPIDQTIAKLKKNPEANQSKIAELEKARLVFEDTNGPKQFVPQTEFDLTPESIDLTQNFAKKKSSFDVTLDDDTVIDDKFLMFVKPEDGKNGFLRDVNLRQVVKGNPGIKISPSKIKFDGSKKEYTTSLSPNPGWTPVQVNNGKIKILPPVKSFVKKETVKPSETTTEKTAEKPAAKPTENKDKEVTPILQTVEEEASTEQPEKTKKERFTDEASRDSYIEEMKGNGYYVYSQGSETEGPNKYYTAIVGKNAKMEQGKRGVETDAVEIGQPEVNKLAEKLGIPAEQVPTVKPKKTRNRNKKKVEEVVPEPIITQPVVEQQTQDKTETRSDEDLVAEPVRSIYDRMPPGPERNQAITNRRAAAVRIAATLKKGDKVIEDGGEGEEFTIEGVFPNGTAFVEGYGEPVDIATMLVHQEVNDVSGNKVQVKPAKIIRNSEQSSENVEKPTPEQPVNMEVEAINSALKFQTEKLATLEATDPKRQTVEQTILTLNERKTALVPVVETTTETTVAPTVEPTTEAKPIEKGVLKNLVSLANKDGIKYANLNDLIKRGFISEEQLPALAEMYGAPAYDGDLDAFAKNLTAAIRKGNAEQNRMLSEIEKFRNEISATINKQRENSEENKERRLEQTSLIFSLAKDVNLDRSRIQIVNNGTQLNREDVSESDRVQGVVENGMVTMILDDIYPYPNETIIQATERIFKHEVVGHLKLSKVLSGLSKKAYDNLVKSLKSDEFKFANGDKVWDRTKAAYTVRDGDSIIDPTDDLIVDEIGAKRSEKAEKENQSIIKKIIRKIRYEFLKAGLIKNWSIKDLDIVIQVAFNTEIADSNTENETSFAKTVDAVYLDSVIVGYGAWISPGGKIINVSSQGHFGKAIEIIGEENTENMTVDGVYDEMRSRGYLRVVNGESIRVDGGKKPSAQQRAVLEFAGINGEKDVYIDDKQIYKKPDVRFSRATNQFDFRLADQLKNPDKINGRLEVAKDGTLPTQSLNAFIKKSGATEFEVDTLTRLVNDLSKDGRVNMSELSNIIDTVPTVVINKLDYLKQVQIEAVNLRKIEHEVETLGYQIVQNNETGKIEAYKTGTNFVRDLLEDGLLPDDVKSKVIEYRNYYEQVKDKLKKGKSIPATGQYGVDPYSSEELKGEEIEPGHKLIWSGDLSLNVPVTPKPKFTSQHYSGEIAANQLAFVRGGIHEYQTGNKLPDGTIATKPTRILEIWEVQSDWAGKISREKKRLDDYKKSDLVIDMVDETVSISKKGGSSKLYLTEKQAKEAGVDVYKYQTNEVISKEDNILLIDKWESLGEDISSPLINYWESLALKAAVNFAQEQGADKIITSDAETAMMTEGHDQGGQTGWENTSGNRFASNGRPTQEPGMKAAYDERVPNGLKKLTNSTPKKVTVGIHNKAVGFLDQDTIDKITNLEKNKGSDKNSEEYKYYQKQIDELSKKPFVKNVFNKTTNTGYMFSVPQNRGVLRFSKVQPQVEEVMDDDFLMTDNNLISNAKSTASREYGQLLKRKLGQRLIIKEVNIYNAFEDIQYAYLPEDRLTALLNDFRDFVNTRTSQENPATTRIDVDTLESRLIQYKKDANQAEYNYWKEKIEKLPDFVDTFKEDIGAVRAMVYEIINENKREDLADISINDSDVATIEAIHELQFMVIDRVDIVDDIINRGTQEFAQGIKESGHPILDKGVTLMQDHLAAMKKLFNEYTLNLVTIDPTDLSKADMRRVYYALLSLSTDGYPNRLNGFISSEIQNLLKSAEAKFTNPYGTVPRTKISKFESTPSMIERMATDDYSYNLLIKLQSPLRDGLALAKRYHEEIITPYVEELNSKYGVMDADTLNKIGIFGTLRQRFMTETPEAALKDSFQWLIDSNKNIANLFDPSYRAQGNRHNEYVFKLFDGINYKIENGRVVADFTKEDVAQFYENANNFIGPKGIGYADDVVRLFESFKPLARFTTEFIYGRTFEEVDNYIPTMSVIIKGEGNELDMSKAQMLTDAKSFSSGQIFYGTNTTGLGSTKQRTRTIGTNRTLVFNINYMAESLGRVAVYDYFTANARQEMAQLLNYGNKNGKMLAKFLGDPDQSQYRMAAFRDAMNGMWQNVMSQASYLHPYHVLTNWLGRKWSQGVLSGVHQFPAQAVSNMVPYFVQHINEPGKIANFVKAIGYIAKYKSGMLDQAQTALMDKVLFEVMNRQQFQEIDKSVNLNISPNSFIEGIKKNLPLFYKSIKTVDSGIERFLFSPFKASDILSGAPMMLAEYLNNEQDAKGTHVRFEDLTYNPASYHKSVDAVERYIGIGDASRRGEFLTNKNAGISIARNLSIAFRSFAINNAVNFGKEWHRIHDSEVSSAQKAKSIKYMLGIVGQSVVYTKIATAISGMVAMQIINAIRHPEEEEELKDLYRKSQNRMSQAERKNLELEISMREQLRKITTSMENKVNDNRIINIRTAKDALSNMYLISNIDLIPNLIIHLGLDGPAEENFKEWKAGEIERIEKLMKRHKNLGNYKTLAKLEEELSAVNMQEFLPAVFEKRSIAGLGGSFGGTAEGIVDAAESSVKAWQNPKAMTPLEFLQMAAMFGVSQPDLKKLMRAYSQKLEVEAKYEEARAQ